MTNSLHSREKIIGRREADVALAEFPACNNFGLKFIMVAEIEMLADGNLAAGSNQAFPLVRILAQLARQQHFYASVKKVTRLGILGADRLRPQASAPAIKAGGKYASVVEHDQVAGPQQLREFAKFAVLKDARFGREMQEAGRSAVRKRLLGD